MIPPLVGALRPFSCEKTFFPTGPAGLYFPPPSRGALRGALTYPHPPSSYELSAPRVFLILALFSLSTLTTLHLET